MHGVSDESVMPFIPPDIDESERFNKLALLVKRVEDIVLGVFLLILFAPAAVFAAILIKLDSPGAIFFCQERRGYNLRPFICYKFRTMYKDQVDLESRIQTRPNDPRITRVGKFLRRYSVDEMPQLFNVIMGQMSLCGPRPHAFGTNIDGHLLEDIDDRYLLRYRVKPGMTGWAQVNGARGILDSVDKLENRIQYDLEYIANWSLRLDLRILAMTMTCVLKDKAH